MRNLLPHLLFLIIFSGELCAGDWPFINGPEFNGLAEGEQLLDVWPADGPQVLWTKELGQGYSAFVAVGDRCLTQYQSAFGQFVLCLNANTGDVLWEHRYDAPFEPLGIYPGPRSSPTVSGGRVYFVSPDAVVSCLELESGQPLWTVHANEDFHGKGTEFGYSASPLVIQGLVILPIGGPGASLVALNSETGKLVWKSGDDTASYCPTVPIILNGETLLVSYLENVITIHDLQGKRHVRRELTSGYDEHAALPGYQEPLLIFSAPFKAGATAYRLNWETADDDARSLTMTVVWQNQQFSNDVTTSVVVGNQVIGFDLKEPQSKAHRPSRGSFRGLDLQTGDVLWSNAEIGQAGVAASGDKLLLLNDRGEVMLAELESSECRVRSKAMVFPKQVCWTRPTLSRGKLFLRSHERAVCLLVGEMPMATDMEKPVIRLGEFHQRRRWDVSPLLNGEREHPLMLPAREELWRWFFSGLPLYLVMLPVGLFLRRSLALQPAARRALELAILSCLGIVSTPLLNQVSIDFWFTWPVAISASLQLALCMSHQAALQPGNRTGYRLARLSGLWFIALCGGFYYVLLRQSEPLLWVFLVGIAPAAPFAIWGERVLSRRHNKMLPSWMLDTAVYSMLFWGAVAFRGLRG